MDADPIARWYALLERLVFGDALQKARVAFLGIAVGAEKKRALLVGDGDGRFLAALLHHAPTITVDYVEPSGKMIAVAKKRVPKSDTARVHFHQQIIQDFPRPEGPYDLLATHFFLDCFEPPELETVIARLASMLAPDAAWLLADFRLPTPESGILRRLRARLLLRVMYRFFGLATGLRARHLTDPADILESRGLNLRARQRFSGDFVSCDHWQTSRIPSR
jgi:ubiquinone/menaquinone biosynthesis C-methylase UbiE